jgi:hypothetical protein
VFVCVRMYFFLNGGSAGEGWGRRVNGWMAKRGYIYTHIHTHTHTHLLPRPLIHNLPAIHQDHIIKKIKHFGRGLQQTHDNIRLCVCVCVYLCVG